MYEMNIRRNELVNVMGFCGVIRYKKPSWYSLPMQIHYLKLYIIEKTDTNLLRLPFLEMVWFINKISPYSK